MKRTVTIIFLVFALVACDRFPGRRVDSSREPPGVSLEAYVEATGEDKLLAYPIPGTESAVGADASGVTPSPSSAGTTDPGLSPSDTNVTNAQDANAETSNVGEAAPAAADTATTNSDAEADAASETATPALEEADAELVAQTSAALETIGSGDVAQTVAVIEAWRARLAGLDNPDAAALSDGLNTLKTELQADTPDENKVNALLYTLGQEASRLALAAPQNVSGALDAFGTTLSEAGEESAVAAEPVDVGGAMPGAADTGGADASTSADAADRETRIETAAPPEEPGVLDMNVQTGVVERDDLGVTDAPLPEAVEGEATQIEGSAQPDTVGEAAANVQAPQENVNSSQAPRVTEGGLLGSAELMDTEGNSVGVVNLVSSNAGIVFEFGLLEGASLAAGEHGFHVHETGACAPDFEVAGAHLNPNGASHGLLSADGPHAGDLPNLVIPEDGEPTYVVTTTRLTQEDLFDDDGSAMMIHAGPDDYVTDPGGNSGDRIACGVLERVEASQ